MTVPNDSNPYAITPKADLQSGGTSANLRYAGFWIRLAASIIDTIAIMIIVMPLLFMIYGGDMLTQGNMSNGFWDVMISYVLPAVLSIALWVTFGGTPGKRLLGLRIVNEKTLQHLTWPVALVRYLGYYLSMLVLFLGFVWVAFDREKKGWHDHLAGSIVIYD